MEKVVFNYLISLGFQPNKVGYRMLFDVLLLGLSGKKLLPLKYNVYPILSQKYDKSVETVEKDIQNAISIPWLKADIGVIYREFGETLDEERGKPTNKHFIVTAINRLRGSEEVL